MVKITTQKILFLLKFIPITVVLPYCYLFWTAIYCQTVGFLLFLFEGSIFAQEHLVICSLVQQSLYHLIQIYNKSIQPMKHTVGPIISCIEMFTTLKSYQKFMDKKIRSLQMYKPTELWYNQCHCSHTDVCTGKYLPINFCPFRPSSVGKFKTRQEIVVDHNFSFLKK